MLAWQAHERGVSRYFTDREDGSSTGPYEGFNLGGHVGDDPDVVATHRARLADVVRAPILFMDQVHGVDVAQVGRDDLARLSETGGVVTADAMVTDEADLALAVLVADCTPILLVDHDAGVVGVAHAGRPGMLAGVVEASLTAMRDLGAAQITASVGPSVCGRCYEVPAEMRAQALATAASSAAVSWSGTPAIDVASGVVDQLTERGVVVEWVPGCTREDPRLYSYRRDGTTGRGAGVVVRRSHVEAGGAR